MSLPLVSILLVSRNEMSCIEKCINSLINQDYPRESLEFLFVDGCSEDGTYDFLEKEVARLKQQGFSARLFVNEKRILASGWNLGIREARGDYVCRIDAHSAIVSSYISTAIQCLLTPGNERVAAIGGWWTHAATTSTGHLIALLLSSPFAVGDSPFRHRPPALCQADTAVYAVYRRHVFSEVGYFDERLARNQDMVMHHQLKAAGYTFLMHPDMEITYYVRSTLGKLMRKAYGDGQWVALAGGEFFSLRHKVPFFFVLYLMLLLVILSVSTLLVTSFPGKLFYALSILPLVGYAFLAVLFSLKAPYGRLSRLILIPLFFAFHIAYGIGTLGGYFKCALRRLPELRQCG